MTFTAPLRCVFLSASQGNLQFSSCCPKPHGMPLLAMNMHTHVYHAREHARGHFLTLICPVQSHHDVIENHLRMMCGPRVLTAFIYFSEVEEGGETEFTMLGGLKVCCVECLRAVCACVCACV